MKVFTRKVDLLILTVLLAGSLGLNVFQFWRSQADPGVDAERGAALKPGDVGPPLEARTTDGTEVVIPMAGQSMPTLIYVFSKGCGWCDANRNNLGALVRQMQDSHRIVLVSRDSDVPEYVKTLANEGATIVAEPSQESQQRFRMIAVPQTILVSVDGKVIDQWIGAYTRSTESDLVDRLKVQLPGLDMASIAGPSGCRDENGGVYSTGAVQEIEGRLQTCGADGRWTAFGTRQ